jgi:hypothetical protein
MEPALRIGGTVVGLSGGLLAGLVAIVANVGLIWFTRVVTGHRGLALLPGVVWFLTVFVGTVRTTEGDLLIPGTDWTGLLALLLGAVAWGITAYRIIPERR